MRDASTGEGEEEGGGGVRGVGARAVDGEHTAPSPAPPRAASSRLRTFRSTFHAALLSQVRGYTLSGWTITAILVPVFLFATAWVVVRFLTGGANPPRFEALTGYPDYVAFVVLGVAFNGLATSALEDGGNAVYEEESNGTWDVLSLAPFDRFVWMGAKTLAGLVTGFVDFFAVLLLGAWVFDVVPTWRGLAVALVGVLLTLVALQGLGFVMAALGLVWKQPYALAFIFSPVLILFSGMTFPVAALPRWAQAVSEAIPLTHGIRVVRDAVLLDRGFAELLPVFGKLALTGALLMTIGFTSFRRMERVARERGVLGRY